MFGGKRFRSYWSEIRWLRRWEGGLTMDPKTDRLVRRMTMVGTATAAYFLLTADYGPYPNALDPIKNAIRFAQHSVKKLIFKIREEPQNEGETNSGPGKGQA